MSHPGPFYLDKINSRIWFEPVNSNCHFEDYLVMSSKSWLLRKIIIFSEDLVASLPGKTCVDCDIKNILSSVKQEVDMPKIRNCLTRYSSPYWCSVPNIKKLACIVPEKNVTEIILWCRRPTTDSDPYVASA